MPTHTLLMKLDSENEYIFFPLYITEEKKEDKALENLINQPRRILKTKLEVFASLIYGRLKIRKDNLKQLRAEESHIEAQFNHWIGGERISDLEKRLLVISKESREQNVDCWKDVVLVMRDFLNVWDNFEEAKAEAILLN